MIIDLRTMPNGAVIEADICVVGGGPVAITLANELRDTSTQLAILESGGLNYDARAQELAGGEVTGIPYFDLRESRVRVFGGSTHRWGARGAPMKPIDFEKRSWMPLSGWPLGLAELDPYYQQVHSLIGWQQPFHYDHRIWEEFEVDPPRFSPESLEYCAFQFGKILQFGHHYRPQIDRAENIRLYLQAQVTNLQSNPAGNHVDHVDVVTVDGKKHQVRAGLFVLASGGIENPRLLLLSNTVQPDGLCNDHGLVGRYFMEHPTVSLGQIDTPNLQRFHDVFSPGLVGRRLVEVGVGLSPQVQAKHECCNAYARTKPILAKDSTQAIRDLLSDLDRRKTTKDFWRLLGVASSDPFGLLGNVVRHALGKPKKFRIESLNLEVRTEQEPNPESRVTLSEETDCVGMRRPHLHWSMTERDRRTMQVMAEVFDGEIQRLGLGTLKPEPWVTSSDHVWSDSMVGGHHHMGTTRMSDDPRTGVVDANCRAHAIDNLYLAGSSIFPTAGYVNPTPTILAMTIRLASHLRTMRPSGSNP